MLSLNLKNYWWKIVIIIFLIGSLKVASAATWPTVVSIPTQNYIQNNNSAFGKLSGPITYFYPFDYTYINVNDNTTWNNNNTFQYNGYNRNLSTVATQIISPTTQQGYNYTRYTGLFKDNEGLEDVNWDFALCNGTYPDPNGTATHTCYKGWPISIAGLSDPVYNNYYSDKFLLYRSDTSDPSYIQQAKQHASLYATSTYTNYAQAGLDYDFYLTGKRSCVAKDVCVNDKVLRHRDTECNYASDWQTCDGICLNGQCDPAARPAANIQTNPITAPSGSPSLPISINSGGGLLQCKAFTGLIDWTGSETYSMDGPYTIDLTIPSGIEKLYYWTAPDTTESQLSNQSPYYGTYDSIDYPSAGNLSFNLWPSAVGGGLSTELNFKNEVEARKVSNGTFGRGDSFVLQFQALYDSGSGYTQTVGYDSPPRVSNPTYLNYTFPSYSQCAPPNEVTPTIQKANMTCADANNTVSWSAVPGADKYMVLVSATPNLSVFDPGYWDYITATTTATSYTFPNPNLSQSGLNESTYWVKVYAHNAKGWNISNSKVSFTDALSGNCDCTVGTTTIPANTSTYLYKNETSNTDCVSYYRYCDGSTGTLSGDTSAIYPTCTLTTTPPPTPTGVTVTPQPFCGGGNVVSWNTVSTASGYRVYRSTSLNGTYNQLTEVSGATSLNFTDSTASPSTAYYYKVSAFNVAGESLKSSAVSATSPAACTTEGAVEISRYGLDLSTIASAPAGTQGKLDGLQASSSNPVFYYNVTQGSHSAKATDLSGYVEKFGTCTYTIGQSECSILANAFTITPTLNSGFYSIPITVEVGKVTKVGVMYVSPPPPPTNLNADTSYSCGKLVDIYWNYVSGATSYKLYRSDSSGGTYTEVAATTNNSITDMTSTEDTTYYYKVSALNSGGESAKSSEISAVSSSLCFSTGSIEISRYSTDLSTPANAPAGTQGQVDNLQASSSNPVVFEGLEGGVWHTVNVINTGNYLAEMATCTYNIGDTPCDLSPDDFMSYSPNYLWSSCDPTTCQAWVYVEPDKVTKVAAMLTSNVSSLRVTQYVDSLNYSANLPPEFFNKLDSYSAVSETSNPTDYDDLGVGSHYIYVPDLTSEYDITYGTCLVNSGDTDCPIAGDGFYNSPSYCDGTYCELYVETFQGQRTKIGVRYVSLTSGVAAPEVTCLNCSSRTSPASGDLRTYYTFNAVSGSSGQVALNKINQTAQVSKALIAQAVPRLKYIFDWDNNGSEADTKPATGYVDQGISVSSVHSWSSENSYTFRVKAVNEQEESSPWTNFTMNIGTTCQPPLQGYAPNCTCISGIDPNETGHTQCVCDGNRQYINGATCSYCPEYKDITSNSCTCRPGTIDNEVNACVPSPLNINIFKVNPDTVYSGDTCNIQFTVEGATSSCSIVGGNDSYSKLVDANGYLSDTIVSSQITSETKFTITCSAFNNSSLSTSKVATCRINPKLKER